MGSDPSPGATIAGGSRFSLGYLLVGFISVDGGARSAVEWVN